MIDCFGAVDLNLPFESDRSVLRGALVGRDEPVMELSRAQYERHAAREQNEQWCKPEP